MRFTRILRKVFRTEFSYPTKDVTNFFPRHMSKGLAQMQEKLRFVDCVVEVHDSRIPLSGRNPYFEETLSLRQHILLLNKMDLSDPRQRDDITDKLKAEQNIQRVLYTDCKKSYKTLIKEQLMPTIVDLLTGGSRYHREGADHFNLLVIGLPNVGKSSLINALRRTYIKNITATPVGPHAGVTRSVMERIRVCNDPRVFVYDSPGIMMPDIPDMETGMKLALCATLTDHIVGYDIISDFMLFWLNSHGHFQYVKYFNLPEPTDDILVFLAHIAKQMKAIRKHKSTSGEYVYRPNFDLAAKTALLAFREGKLGRFNLDEDLLKLPEKESIN